MLGGMADLTRLLDAAAAGDPRVAAELLPLVYDELRKLAAARVAAEPPGQTLQATALVHEAYVRLVGPADAPKWSGRGHFFAAAAEAMRRILVEAARRKATRVRGGDRDRVDLDRITVTVADDPRVDMLDLDEALTELEQHDRRAAELVKLRFFAGLSHQAAAEALGISRGVADRLWALARAWLYRRITAD
jgi:RNA polymerase sigma factor (TIGR02999 family)